MSYDSDVRRLAPSGLLNLRLAQTAYARAIQDVLGFALPEAANSSCGRGDVLALRLGPNEWLLRLSDGGEEACAAKLRGALQGKHVAVTCVSDAYIVFEISGPDACELLCQGTGIDVHPTSFPTGQCVRTRFARARVAIYVDAAGRSYHLFVPRSYAEYMTRWLERARGLI